ncbi:enoyl-CoA hydratase/isomerase family protein [Saccharopolyspora endophytica]|uniref:Enoyl-CoA hydratase/isomerase family protein n=1 Tax=Saccharopolyspora endophytica TaxID=543886 RepID=A0ABS5DB46_9PSEU|nr:enoyl-CoA hydratase-related protein [Saccharopolyspora endophytica]MBQ0923488.1 enoyl-CoA hydratase/isomerase family protein [Saccharopolyspora endophytica]
MNYQTIDLLVDDGLAELVLNDAEPGNPMGAVFCREFGQVANELAKRGDVRAVLLRAEGRFFSVGGDVNLFSRDLDAAPAAVRDGTFGLHMGLTRLLRMDAPIVACAHASAAGGAVSLLSHCDVVYAARSARFTAAYAQLGFTCDLGATAGFASRMGIARARRFLLLSESLDADEALGAGLVDHVVADHVVAEQARATAVALAAGPTRAFGEVRRLVARSLATPLETQLEDEAQSLARAAATADAREGISAFAARRQPRFSGF